VKVPSELAEISFVSVEDAKTAKITVSKVTKLSPNIPPLAGAAAYFKIDHSGFGQIKGVTLKVKAAPGSLLWRYFGETWTALRGGSQKGEYIEFYSPGLSIFALTGPAPAITGAAVSEPSSATEFQPSAPSAPTPPTPAAPTLAPRQEAPSKAAKEMAPATGTFLVIVGAVIAALAVFGLLVSRRKPKAPA